MLLYTVLTQGAEKAAAETKDHAALIISGLFGLVTTIVPLLDAYFQRRALLQQRIANLEEASKEVVFWKAWLEIQLCVADDIAAAAVKSVVARNLSLLADRQEQRSAEAAPTIPYASRSIFQRTLLMYFPVEAVWVPRVLFFSLLSYLLYGFLVLGTDPQGTWHALHNDWEVPAIVVVFLFFLHRIAVQTEERRRIRKLRGAKQVVCNQEIPSHRCWRANSTETLIQASPMPRPR